MNFVLEAAVENGKATPCARAANSAQTPTTLSYSVLGPNALSAPSNYSAPYSSLQRNFKESWWNTLNRLNALRMRGSQWNGYDIPAPDEGSIDQAIQTFRNWCVDAHILDWSMDKGCFGRRWMEPHVSSDEEGHVVLEWLHDNKSLTLYFSSGSVEYVKAWGSDVENAMDDGEINTSRDWAKLWLWLIKI